MNIIDKKIFCSVIESIQLQMLKDREIGSFFVVNKSSERNATCIYDNRELIKSLVKLLQIWFPKDNDGFCEIEHYLFHLEFGNTKSKKLQTAEELYYFLMQTK